jgi:WD40 repeat protein
VTETKEAKHVLEGPDEVVWMKWHRKGHVVRMLFHTHATVSRCVYQYSNASLCACVQIIAGGADGMVWMFNASKGSVMQVFAGHRGDVMSGCFSGDGKTVRLLHVHALFLLCIPVHVLYCYFFCLHLFHLPHTHTHTHTGHHGRRRCVGAHLGPQDRQVHVCDRRWLSALCTRSPSVLYSGALRQAARDCWVRGWERDGHKHQHRQGKLLRIRV